jgi:phosphate-selective porin OprO/OprP
MAQSRAVSRIRPLPLALALVTGWAAAPALAIAADTDPAIAAEMAALRAELSRLQARLEQLETRAQAPAAASAPVETATVEAGPGLGVESADGERAFSIGGRLHYDLYAHDTGQREATGGTEFRRARVNVDGAAAGWNYRVQVELSGGNVDLRDVYLEHELAGGTLTLGQFKPFRSLEELTSSNDISVMERGFTSASGLFADRQWQQGIGWLRPLPAGSLGLSVFSLREDNTRRNEGWGAAARGTWAPILNEQRLVHLGAWGSYEDGGQNTPSVEIEAAYAGRRGPSALLFESTGGGAFEQRSAGLEFAGRLGGFHWQSEWARATLAGAAGDGRLEAAYLQAGWVFGGVRAYDAEEGVFDGIEDVGEGRWEAIARVDRIRLRDAGQTEARRFILGITRYVTDDLRLMLNWVDGEDRSIDDEAGQLAFRIQQVF